MICLATLATSVLSLAPFPPAQDDRSSVAVAVASDNGAFTAEIRKAEGQERVADSLARWMLSVRETTANGEGRETWSCRYPYDAGASDARAGADGDGGDRGNYYLLTNDGSTFVHVKKYFSEFKPVVRIHRAGEELSAGNGVLFGLDLAAMERTSAGRLWLLPEDGACRIAWADLEGSPVPRLELSCRGNSVRYIDLDALRIATPEDWSPPMTIRVDLGSARPHLTLHECEVPYLTSYSAPRHARADAAMEVVVSGSHPTSGWSVIGFNVALEPGVPKLLSITPAALPPRSDVVIPQVLEPFQSSTKIAGLAPGRYLVQVSGRSGPVGDPRPLEVLPRGLVVQLKTTGGFMGVDERALVFQRGVARLESSRREGASFVEVPRSSMSAIEGLIAALSADVEPKLFTAGADLFTYELGWWRGDEWTLLVADDMTAQEPFKELVLLLRALR